MHRLTIMDNAAMVPGETVGMSSVFHTRQEAVVALYLFALTQIEYRCIQNDFFFDVQSTLWLGELFEKKAKGCKFSELSDEYAMSVMKGVIYFNSAKGYQIMEEVIAWFFDELNNVPGMNARYIIAPEKYTIH